MTQTRILPPAEWPRLAGTEAETVWPVLDPENSRVCVVEDDGQIVACWLFLRTVHAECIWIRPSHRGRLGVTSRLLRGLRRVAAEWKVRRVITGSVSPIVTNLIERLGGQPIPCASFVLPVPPPESDWELGRRFHAQLHAVLPDDQAHPDDDDHDRHVGRALRTAIHERAPERAVDDYNAWAATSGYAPIRYLGMVDGRLRADIVFAVVDIDGEYGVHVVEQEAMACHS